LKFFDRIVLRKRGSRETFDQFLHAGVLDFEASDHFNTQILAGS
jgi:hypothetical protein